MRASCSVMKWSICATNCGTDSMFEHSNITSAKRIRRLMILAVLLLIAATAFGQQTDTGLLTVASTFTYEADRLDAVRWQADGSGYFVVEPVPGNTAASIIRYDAASGAKTVFVSAEKLVPT